MSNEFLLNHHEIYHLIYNGDTLHANNLLSEQFQLLQNASLQQIRFFLSSLNQGIYNYIFNKESISLHDCCYRNEQQVQLCTYANFQQLGEAILTSYSTCNDYLVEKHNNEHIKKAISYIHEHLGDALSLISVCEAINLNHCYLCELFRKEVGMNFSDYVLIQRIKLAKHLLLHSSLSINFIATKCGFNSASYFSTCFKKIENVTPASIRQ